MENLKFMISSLEAKEMTKKQGLNSVLQLLPLILKSSKKLARPPISGFSVAALGLASDGRVFIGVNIEFPGLPLHHSIHAEQFLIVNLFSYPDVITLTYVIVSEYPCGHCRQFLQEIKGSFDVQILVLQNYDDHLIEENLEALFRPLFGPNDMLDKDVPLILETHENGLILLDEFTNGNLVNGFSSSFDVKSVALVALEAANRSHAPYSRCPSGMALVDDKEGNVFKGSYMESAAYNPSLGPAQAAVIAYIAATAASKYGLETGYGKIVGAVLVEKEGAIVRQEETVKFFLKAVMPKCVFHVYHCRNSSSVENGNLAN